MQLRRGASTILAGLAAISAGCADSQTGYKEFSQLEPSKLDQASVVDSVPSEQESKSSVPVDDRHQVTPASATETTADSSIELAHSTDGVVKKSESGEPLTSAAGDSPTSASTVNAPGSVAEKVSAENTAVTESIGGESPDGRAVTMVVSKQSGLQGPADTPEIENSALSEPRKIELLVPENHLRKERGSNAVRVTYDDIDLLKVLNMEPVPVDATDHFPEWLSALNGKPIRIRGFMYPTFEASGLTEFALARDNGICCFVRQPKIYDIISVVMADGVTTDYIEGRPFDVEGTFHIDPKADETNLSRLYRIDNARVLR